MVIKTEKAAVSDTRYVVCQVAVHESLVEQGDSSFMKSHELSLYIGSSLGKGTRARLQDGLAGVLAGKDLVHSRHSE